MVMINEHIKRYYISRVIRKIGIKTTIDTTSHPPEWLITVHIGKNMEQLEL